jgi:hypothetical protein
VELLARGVEREPFALAHRPQFLRVLVEVGPRFTSQISIPSSVTPC